MCGIGGYIGQSKNPKVTYELITHIFNYLETRGTDAAGIYGIGSGKNDKIIYHKEAVKASDFIKLPMWERVQSFDPSVLLVHARATSPNGGHAKFNKNNHPFVSADKRIGLVHNGNINEIDFLKKKYEMASECDSEILLRMYEAPMEEVKIPSIPGTPPEVCVRMKGIQDMWSVINRGAMAVAIAERIDQDVRYMFLFRNDKRPLWLADMRDKLGQIFFFSSVDIWFRAIKDCKSRQMFENQKLVELPEKQVWYFRIDGEDTSVTEDNFMKFNIELKNTYKEWKPEDFVKIQPKKVSIPVITELDNEDEKETPTTKQVYPKSNKIYRKPQDDNEDDIIESYQGTIEDMEAVVSKIEHLLQQINTQVANAAMEGSLTLERYQEVVDSLEQNRIDLEGTFQIVKHY